MCKTRQSVKYLLQNLPDSCTLSADLAITFRKISTMNYIKISNMFSTSMHVITAVKNLE